MNTFGALFAILSSASFGLNTAAIRRGVLGSSASQAVYITVIGGVPLLVIAAAVSGQLFEVSGFSARSYLLLVVAGILHFLIGRYCNYRCIGAIGATRAGPVRAITTPYTLLLAVILLGERPTWVNVMGIILIMSAPLIMLERRGQPGRRGSEVELSRPIARRSTVASTPKSGSVGEAASANTTPAARTEPQEAKPEVPIRMAEGYFFGFLTALAYGTSFPLVRAAVADTGLGILGALISYTSAAVLLVLWLTLPGRRASAVAIDRGSVRWFLLATFTVFLAQMFRYIALDLAPVTVVVPLGQTGAIFTLLFAFLINRNLESFSPRVLAAIALAGAGSLAIVQ